MISTQNILYKNIQHPVIPSAGRVIECNSSTNFRFRTSLFIYFVPIHSQLLSYIASHNTPKSHYSPSSWSSVVQLQLVHLMYSIYTLRWMWPNHYESKFHYSILQAVKIITSFRIFILSRFFHRGSDESHLRYFSSPLLFSRIVHVYRHMLKSYIWRIFLLQWTIIL